MKTFGLVEILNLSLKQFCVYETKKICIMPNNNQPLPSEDGSQGRLFVSHSVSPTVPLQCAITTAYNLLYYTVGEGISTDLRSKSAPVTPATTPKVAFKDFCSIY